MFNKIKILLLLLIGLAVVKLNAQSVIRTGTNCTGAPQTFTLNGCTGCSVTGYLITGTVLDATLNPPSVNFSWSTTGSKSVKLIYTQFGVTKEIWYPTSMNILQTETINHPVINVSPTGATVAGTPLTFTVVPAIGSFPGGLTFSFYVKGVLKQQGSSNVFTPSDWLENGDEVSVTVSSSGECAVSANASKIVSGVTPLPLPLLPAVSANTCGPKTITFPVNTTGTTWYNQGATPNGRSTSSPITTSSFTASSSFYVNTKNNSAWSADLLVTITDEAVDIEVPYYANELEQATHSISIKPGFIVPAGKVFTARIAITPECNDYINWSEQIVYNENGQPISRGRTYFDGFSNELQTQAIDFSNGKVWTTQPLYNNLNVAVGASLPAPILENDFIYKKKFIRNNAGQTYSANDFDKPVVNGSSGEINNPAPVGKDAGTLGWYYSNNNSIEPNTPTTNYPYERGYTPPGPNPLISKSASIGDQHKMGSGHEVIGEKQKIEAADLVHYYALKPFFTPVSINNILAFSVDADAAALQGFNAGNVSIGVFNGETYATNQSTSTALSGIFPIGSTTEAYTVVPGASYTFKVKGYRVGTGNAHLYVRQGLSGADLVWAGAILPLNQANEAWVQNTFTVPAGVTSITVGVRWSTSTTGSTMYLNKLQLYKEGGDLPIGYKSISTDPSGKKVVSFVDTEGQTLATALLTGSTYSNWSYSYYNELGQVVATVAPNGVNTSSTAMPEFVTYYKYDHLGRLIETTSTDEGTSQSIYSLDGKIKFSQNQVQRDATPKRFSYTNYDYLGRGIESGEYTCSGTNPYVFEPATTVTPAAYSVLSLTEDIGYVNLSQKVGVQATRCTDYSFVEYDKPGSGFVTNGTHTTQTNTFGQVTKTENANASTWYSYDEFGQLTWSMQNIAGLGIKTIDYAYDYFGNTTQVMYAGTVASDKFYHHYEYDINQKLTSVYTSLDGTTKSLQAKYYYYQHGPLKRVELGNKIQGIDYVYNIDGSLKLINNADPALDPGQDGISGTNAGFMKDVFGETLDYNPDDYTGASYAEGNLASTSTPAHFDGLVQGVRWHSAVDTHVKRAYAFTYDNLNQLDNAEFGDITGTSTNSFTPSPLQAYKEDVTGYDKNGNITGMVRKGKTGNSIANYTYNYQANTNKLLQVTGGTSPINYQYNALGQMTQQSEGSNAMNISYTVSGLVKEIRNASNNLTASYYYDDRGGLVHKTYYNNGTIVKHVYYVSDVAGNSMAIYQQDVANAGALILIELPVYGAGRVAVYKPVVATVLYEVSDHLGNVRGVVGNPLPLTYTATLEDNGVANITNPRVQELAYFKNITTTAVQDADMNHTATSTAMPVPKYSAYLKWISGFSGQDAADKSVGPALGLRVEAGDKIDIEAWAKYEKKSSYSRSSIVGAMASILGSSYVGTAAGLDVLANATQVFQNGISLAVGTVAGNGDDPTVLPFAYVYYVLYDRNFNLVTQGCKRVSSNAGFDPGNEALSSHEKLTIPTVTITEPGYIYAFVSNESENTEIWFDDLQVTQQRSSIVAGADFYPFGLAMENREITREDYRYGYQGQYSEKDKTTGWNEFELRMYDPKIGRWLTVDPYGQFDSPYLGMGNIPNMGTDPDGGMCCGWSWVATPTTLNAAAGYWVKGSSIVADVAVGAAQAAAKLAVNGGKGAVNNLGTFYGGAASFYGRVTGGNIRPTTFSTEGFYEWGSFTGWNISRNSAKGIGDVIITAAEGETLGGVFKGGKHIYRAVKSARAASVTLNVTAEVSAEGAVWAQKTFSGAFSAEGKFAGQTVDDVVSALGNGTLSAAEVPIDVVVRNGTTFILNTRSSAALVRAGIPRSAWNIINRTGVSAFESRLSNQLGKNGLTKGTNVIRQSKTKLTISH